MNTQVAEILELSVAEKIQIVEDIWDSISQNPEQLPLSEAEKMELDKRLRITNKIRIMESNGKL